MNSVMWIGVILLAVFGCFTVVNTLNKPNYAALTANSTNEINAISWEQSKSHIGERAIVYGQAIGATYAFSSKGQPTFLNMGKNYPDFNRFIVLIWGSDRNKFSPPPNIQYKGKMIYVYGLIELYDGSAEIIVTDPSQIQVQ